MSVAFNFIQPYQDHSQVVLIHPAEEALTQQAQAQHGPSISLLLPQPWEPQKSQIHRKYQVLWQYSKEKYTVS